MLCETYKMNRCLIWLLDDGETALILRPDGGFTFTEFERVDSAAVFLEENVALPEPLVEIVDAHFARLAGLADFKARTVVAARQRRQRIDAAFAEMFAATLADIEERLGRIAAR
jgi:hypothetical protein